MKNLFLTFFLSCVISFSYSQSNLINCKYLAKYEVEWQPDSLDIKSKIKLEKYSLLFNNSKSIFISDNRLALDTLIYGNKNSFKDMNKLMSMPKPTSNKRIFKTKLGIFKVINEVRGQLFKYDDDANLKWKLLKEVDSINGMKVQKASTVFRGRKYIAYYSEEIPMSFGPYKFSGLPGLILKIYDVKKHISFNLIRLTPFNKKIPLNYDNEVTVVQKKEFIKAEKQYKTNPIPYMESQGAVFSEETKRIIREKFRKRNKKTNNPIELKENNE